MEDNNSKITTIVVLIILVIGLSLYFFNSSGNNIDKKRTIMIYMSGSDLESKAGYTGGSSKWHNNLINSTENAIYELKDNGFSKIKSYSQKNMSTSDTLEDYLKYVYENYKTDKYDLIVWDHGGAWQGAVSDDFNKGDYLELSEFNSALSNSPFKDNKLEAVIFKTCLNSSYEVGVTLAPYANYLVGSEEVTFAGNIVYALDFLNDIDGDTDPITIGEMFADSYYNNTVVKGNLVNRKVMAFSVVDLTKIDTLTEEIGNFFNGINS